jgi:hypothetical protein
VWIPLPTVLNFFTPNAGLIVIILMAMLGQARQKSGCFRLSRGQADVDLAAPSRSVWLSFALLAGAAPS